MANLILDAAVCNHKGKIRSNNEDNFYLNGLILPLEQMDEGGCFAAESQAGIQLYAVCDGMGGEAAGEQASFQAVEALKALRLPADELISQETLTDCLQQISNKIYQDARAQGMRSGTTFAGCLWQGGRMLAAHVGDSRVYRIRSQKLEQLTSDHSEVQRMVFLGLISAEEARTHPKRHIITQHLGMRTEEVRLSPAFSPWMDCLPGDRYLICSDGLTDMLEDREIMHFLSEADKAETAASALVQAALNQGGRDNVTVLCLYLIDPASRARWTPLQKALLSGALTAGLMGALYLAEYIFRLL